VEFGGSFQEAKSGKPKTSEAGQGIKESQQKKSSSTRNNLIQKLRPDETKGRKNYRKTRRLKNRINEDESKLCLQSAQKGYQLAELLSSNANKREDIPSTHCFRKIVSPAVQPELHEQRMTLRRCN